MAEPAETSTAASAEDHSGISTERQQLLLHTEQTEDCTRCESTDQHERSTRCQFCGQDEFDPRIKQMYGKIESFSPWFPETDPTNPRALTWTKKLSHRGTSLFIQILISTTALIFNISAMIYAGEKYGISNGFGDIYQGDCNLVARYNTMVHLGINIVSTLLLGASNYCAQLLVAPTRSEVDRAHEKGDWLDVGVPSLRNLRKRRIAGKRKATWTLLMTSSVLLHLVWNSAVFAAKPSSSYRIAMVTSDYLADAGPWPTQNNQTLHLLQNSNSLSYLNKSQCIERYISPNPGQMDVLVVTANVTMRDRASMVEGDNSSSLLCEGDSFDGGTNWIWAQSWLCSADAPPGRRSTSWCTADYLAKEVDWIVTEYSWISNGVVGKSFWAKVDHCLSAGVESLESHCALRFSALILLMVCILNAVKCTAIYYTAYLHYRSDTSPRDKTSLVTVGDAVASFLEENDLTTQDLPFASREEFSETKWPIQRSPWLHPGPSLCVIPWFKAASRIRWLVTIAFCVAVLSIVAVLLAKGVDAERSHGIAVDIGSIAAQGLGASESYATAIEGLARSISQFSGFYLATLFANMWQVIYSVLYLLYNGLLTTMLVANEWNNFIAKRQTLRLSSPRGIQRSSYSLSLPYRFAIPLMIASGTLHWLISQSVFVIQTIGMAYGTDFYRYPANDSSLIGYSNIGIIYSLILGSIMVIVLVIMGLCNSYRPRPHDKERETAAQSYTMPLVSTCSAAISAACHRPDEDFDSHLLPVRWGFVGGKYWCFTTSREVSYPELGPGTELKALAKKSDSKESDPELQIDIGPAFEVPIRSQDGPSQDNGVIVKQGAEVNDTSTLLRRSSASSEEAEYRSTYSEEILPASYMRPGP